MTEIPVEDTSLWLEIFIVLLLVLLNGFFAMSELAIVSARRARLKPIADAGHRGARKALELAEDPTMFLSTVQIGITLVGVVAGAYSGATLSAPLARALGDWPLIADYAYPVAVTLVVASITYLSLIIGELVPKRIAMNHAEAIAMRVSLPMALIAKIGAPLVMILRLSTNAILTLIGLSGDRDTQVTEEEVKTMVAEGAESGVFDEEERYMIDRVLHLADYSIRSIMTPRPDIDWIDVNDPAEVSLQHVIASGHSRLLLCQGNVDEVLGVVDAKDAYMAEMAASISASVQQANRSITMEMSASRASAVQSLSRCEIEASAYIGEVGSIPSLIPACCASAALGAMASAKHSAASPQLSVPRPPVVITIVFAPIAAAG